MFHSTLIKYEQNTCNVDLSKVEVLWHLDWIGLVLCNINCIWNKILANDHAQGELDCVAMIVILFDPIRFFSCGDWSVWAHV